MSHPNFVKTQRENEYYSTILLFGRVDVRQLGLRYWVLGDPLSVPNTFSMELKYFRYSINPFRDAKIRNDLFFTSSFSEFTIDYKFLYPEMYLSPMH